MDKPSKPKKGNLPPDEVWVCNDAGGFTWRRVPVMSELWRCPERQAGALKIKVVEGRWGPLTWMLPDDAPEDA